MRSPWHLTLHAADAAAGIFQALSLSQANYKPIPRLPTRESLARWDASLNEAQLASSFHQYPHHHHGSASGSHSGSESGSGTGAGKGEGTKVHFLLAGEKGAPKLSLEQNNDDQWGEPSYLLLPKNSSYQQHGNGYAQQQPTIGPGKCSVINQSYVPVGGWSTLPDNVTFDPLNQTKANILRYRQQVGVNLGSWFLSENWIAPSLFNCAVGNASAEHDILAGYGNSSSGVSNATAHMEQHWDTWIREEDFATMAELGINTVRIPIGYWDLGGNWTDGTPFHPWAHVYDRAYRFLARGIQWAAKYDIGVLIDLHGAYGAANTGSISGVSNGEVGFFSPGNQSLTTAFLTNLTTRLVNVTNVVGIELLNEPEVQPGLWKWYNATLDHLRAAVPGAQSFPLYIQDGYQLDQGARFVSSRKDFVIDDTHLYYVYTSADKDASAGAHTRQIDGPVDRQLQGNHSLARGNLMVGEWSCALSPSSLQNASDPQQAERRFCQAENSVFGNQTAGTLYWTWRMEQCESNSGWCLRAAAKEFLTTPFSLWNISGGTYDLIGRMNGTQQMHLSDLIASNVSSLPVPSLPAKLRPAPTSTPGSGSESKPTHTRTSFHSSTSSVSSPFSSHRGREGSTFTTRSSSATSGSSRFHQSKSSQPTSIATESSHTHSQAHSHHSHGQTHSQAHSHSGHSATGPSSSSAPAGETVVTWSEPIELTTSFEVSGALTLTLPETRSLSHRATETHAPSSLRTSSASASASASRRGPQSSKPSSSSAVEVPGRIEERAQGMMMGRRGGSPAARAAAAMRHERQQRQEQQERQDSPAMGKTVSATSQKQRMEAMRSEHKHEQETEHEPSQMGQHQSHAHLVASAGYSDGFLSAKIFASANLGRIGFAGQYIQDSWSARLASSDDRTMSRFHVADQSSYTQAFQLGLDDGHGHITSAIEQVVASVGR